MIKVSYLWLDDDLYLLILFVPDGFNAYNFLVIIWNLVYD